MKEYNFTENIEKVKKDLGIRGDYLSKFLEKLNPETEEEAINAIKAKYGKGEVEAAPEIQQGNEHSGDIQQEAGVQESDVVPSDVEVSAPSLIGECDASVENTNDAAPERQDTERTVSEKLYVQRVEKSTSNFVHPVTGLPV